jgi:hypothetical protein
MHGCTDAEAAAVTGAEASTFARAAGEVLGLQATDLDFRLQLDRLVQRRVRATHPVRARARRHCQLRADTRRLRRLRHLCPVRPVLGAQARERVVHAGYVRGGGVAGGGRGLAPQRA